MNKVATIQMCSTDIVDDNLTMAASLIEKAAINGAILAVLPEMFAVIGSKISDKVDIKEIAGSGKIQDFISTIAIKHNIWIVGGTIPIACCDANKIRAACVVFDNNGNQVARYDKIHLFDASISKQEQYRESDTTEPGEQTIVVNTPVGKLGLCVCYDIRFPGLFAKLSQQGAEIIAIPAAFTVPTGKAHWEILARCRAIDSFCYVVGACQGGIHTNDRETYGHSMVVSPWGEVIKEIINPGNGIAYAELDLKKVYEVRKKFGL